MRFISLGFLLILLNCSTPSTQTASNDSSNLTEPVERIFLTDSTTYEVKILDHIGYWDDVQYDRSLKTTDIGAFPKNLSSTSIELTSRVNQIIDSELEKSVKTLFKWYQGEGMKPDLVPTRSEQQLYENGTGSYLIYQKYNVGFEYSEIVILSIWKPEKLVYTYSTFNKLGVNMELFGFKVVDDQYEIYGNLEGNPETVYGGDFFLRMANGIRTIGFSYYEDNG